MLTPIAPSLWGAEHDLFMPGGVHFRGRMTVVQLPDGGLLLHSPVPIDAALAADLAALGPVRVLVAPNLLHHVHLAAAQERWPEARTWGAPGLAEKCPHLRIDAVLGEQAPPWADVLAPHFIAGMPWMQEHAFFHRPTATLLVTDLFFHIERAVLANWTSRALFWMLGLLDGPAQSPLVRLQARDRPAAGESARALVALPVARLVPAHGPVIDRDAPAVLRRVLGRQLSWAPAGALADGQAAPARGLGGGPA